jgi:hypothetical protein
LKCREFTGELWEGVLVLGLTQYFLVSENPQLNMDSIEDFFDFETYIFLNLEIGVY